MSNLMINKLKHIDNSRKDLQVILENKGVNLANSNKSLDSLIANVGQLNLNNNVNSSTWEGVIKQDDPGRYWKGDEDWRNVIDIDAIMEADTNDYQGKVFFLIRCSDNPLLDDWSGGYTEKAIVGFQGYRFSDGGIDEIATTTSHRFDPTRDIVTPNGERFRWIIGYTNSTTSVVFWQGSHLVPEAVVYWSGTFRGICFEDAAPYSTGSGSSTNYTYSYAYDNGSGGYSYYTSFSITNYNKDYLICVAPRYFEVKEGVETQFIMGDYGDRYTSTVHNERTRTIIVDGTVVCEFVHAQAPTCTYARFTKPGYRRYFSLQFYNRKEKLYDEDAYVYADISGCKENVWCAVSNGYVELRGNMNAGTITFSKMYYTNILAENVYTLSGAEGSVDCNFDFKVIQGSVNDRCFMDCTGHLKFDYIQHNIGYWAFRNFKNIPTEIIVKKEEGYTGTHGLGYGAFIGTNVEKIDLRDSPITSLNGSTYDPERNDDGSTYNPFPAIGHPFYGAPKLKIIHLPRSMTEIRAYACSRLSSVTTITLPENLVTVGERAFFDCPLLETLSLPTTVQNIGNYAFADCMNLKVLDIPSDLMTYVPERMCANCHSLQKVTLPENLVSIRPAAFASCRSLERVVLPNTVTNIAEYAFEYNHKLESVTYNDPSIGRMVYLGNYCFQGCFKLTDLFDLSTIVDGMNGSSTGYDYLYHPFMNCYSMTFTLLANRPTNLSDAIYYEYFYRCTGAKILVPEDYAYTGTLWLHSANWSLRNFLDFIQSVPDRTGGTATKFNLGCDYRNSRYSYSSTSDPYTPYSIYGTRYKYYYVKEVDGVLEGSVTQEDDTWVSVPDYIAAKNCTLS